jgi:membrane protease YdiL (CAAX protease family)
MTATRSRAWTLAGLALALIAAPALIVVQRAITGPIAGVPQILARESMLFALAAVLLLIILRGERLPLSSVGINLDRPGRTALLALGIFVALGAGVAVALLLLHVVGLPTPNVPGYKPPPGVVTLVMIRAGIVEELFYRGYAIERLEWLTKNKWVAAIVPLLVFTAAHVKLGVSGMIAAFILGSILTAFYMWKRNLIANMTGHFLIDFVPNVLLPALGG